MSGMEDCRASTDDEENVANLVSVLSGSIPINAGTVHASHTTLTPDSSDRSQFV
jgi:hypothetical protein